MLMMDGIGRIRQGHDYYVNRQLYTYLLSTIHTYRSWLGCQEQYEGYNKVIFQ